MSKVEYRELIAFHPGYYLKEIIDEMGITQDEFAKRLVTTGKNLSDLLNGNTKLSNEIALNLSIMLGTSVDLWLNMQKTYNEKIIEIERRKVEDKEAECVQMIDYSYFVKLEAVPSVRTATKKAEELLKYFRISSFDVFKRSDFLVNFRMASTSMDEKNLINSNAWVQTALNIGKEIQTEAFNSKKLKDSLPKIRKMTLHDPEFFLPKLHDLLASCGIALVILPHLKNSGVNGAVKWVSKEKVILAINNRRKYADTFWFSLFHEIGHVFQKKIKMLIISGNIEDMDEANKELEDKADNFAQNILLPKEKYIGFIAKHDFSEEAVKKFAKDIDIHPGIVAGRLQKEGYVRFDQLNRLKEQYIIE